MSMILKSSNLIRKTLIPSSFTFFTKSISYKRLTETDEPLPSYVVRGFPKRFFDPKPKLLISDLPPNQQQVIKLFSDMLQDSTLYESKRFPYYSDLDKWRPRPIVRRVPRPEYVFRPTHPRPEYVYFLEMLRVLRKKCLLLVYWRRDREEATAGSSYYKKLRSILPPPDDTYETTKLLSDLPPNLQQVIKLLLRHPARRATYYFRKVPLSYSRILPTLHRAHKASYNKVDGCTSHIWVRAYIDDVIVYDPDHKVWFEAYFDDCAITRALAGLLIQSLSGRPLSELTHPDFFTLFQQSITPTTPFYIRFLCMLKVMQKKCLLLADQVMQGKEWMQEKKLTQEKKREKKRLGGSRSERIKEILERELSPVKLEVEEHAQLNVRIVSKELEGKSVPERHKMIRALLKDELDTGFGSQPFALSIVAKAPPPAV